jgi:hypothetical protein
MEKMHPEVKAYEEAESKIKSWLTYKPGLEAVNAALRDPAELAGLKPDLKRKIWPLLEAYGVSQGWTWNREERRWQ